MGPLRVPGLFLGVNVPDDVVWKTVDLVTGTLGHLRESFRLGLIFESVAREVDTLIVVSFSSMNPVCLEQHT